MPTWKPHTETPDAPPTTAELRAAWDRAWLLRFRGWTFERAMAVPLVRKTMEKSAIAHRQPDGPDQGVLI